MQLHRYAVRSLLPCLAPLLLGACGTGGGAAPAPPPATSAAPEIACQGEADANRPVAVAPGRAIYCAIDLGSKNAKLQVISMEPGRPLSFEDERLCKAPLGLGAKVFDQKTGTRSALSAADIANLATVVERFEQICATDHGTLVGAEATQWARDATNIAEVTAAVKAATAIEIEVLTPEQEGLYGYTAATRDRPGWLSLDPGSNSFQIGWFEKGAARPRSVSLPFGFVRAAAEHYPVTAADGYDVARKEHAAHLVAMIEAALGALEPSASLASLRRAIANGKLEPVIYLVGQDGALHLAVRAELRGPDGRWVDSKAGFEARAGKETTVAHPDFGPMTTVLTPAEVDVFFAKVMTPADFDALRMKPVREIYGEKALANTVLADTLIEQLGLTAVVLVPQEMPAGYILSKIARRQYQVDR